ncbi:hypothetical protein C8R45DRAFT_1186364 [Mycena sanguinolenta]|nr:hypothetical protein C8R45DRAFT_1186364 [Mycena sanguinolenta]
MFDIMLHDATDKSEGGRKRDGRAMVWALKSLSDDDELELFLEALPELIWGPSGWQHRLGQQTCSTGFTTSSSNLLHQRTLGTCLIFGIGVTSTTILPNLRSHLKPLPHGIHHGRANIAPLLKLSVQMRVAELSFSAFSSALEQLINADWTHTSTQQVLDVLNSCTDLAYDILADYCCSSAGVEHKSYEFEATSSLIQQVALRPSTVAAMQLKDTFADLINTNQILIDNQTNHPLDASLNAILHVLQRKMDCLVDMRFQAMFLY